MAQQVKGTWEAASLDQIFASWPNR